MASKMKVSYYLSVVVVVFLLSATTSLINAAVPLPRYEALMKQQSQTEQLGLYNASDNVVVLTSANFKEMVLQQNRSSLVEFYNSYCGHCKRFAPFYKELAEQIYSWREVLPVCALDCAAEENNGICREYEVMAYPTLRYFGPGYAASAGNYGHQIDTQLLPEIREQVALWMESENRTANMTNWPNMQNLTMSEATSLFKGLDNQLQFVVLVYEPDNSTLGTESVLHFQRWPLVQVRRVNDNEVAAKFQIDGTKYKIATVDRHGTIVPYKSATDTPQAYAAIIESILRAQNLTERPELKRKVASSTPNSLLQEEHRLEEAEKEALIAEVKQNKHLVYQADLEMAIRGVLYNEIPKIPDINGERLLALQRFLAVLQRYNPLGTNGRALVTNLYEFVMQYNQHLTGQTFEEELHRLDKKLSPIFSATHFVGCSASVPGLRGFTCSLWTLFHFLTVQAARREVSQDPLEVLQSMHGYVKYFFGCTDCAEHFQDMATRRKIWSTPNKDEAILWLWAAHNEVNQRLSKDPTEDPHFPKIQFPSQSSCSQCYKQPIVSPANLDISWNKDAVLSFLKNIHNPEYVSRYGVEREELLHSTIEKLRQKRMITNVFSDIDMRMGMLLYGFCIVMMVVAFKLFAFKGYRKKPYGHDMLGKV